MFKKYLNNKFLETKFKDYLVNLGLSQYSASGNKSTVYDYCTRIKRICKEEKVNWIELAKNINNFVSKYNFCGPKEWYGKKGHRSVINALKKYADFYLDISRAENIKKVIIVDLSIISSIKGNFDQELLNREFNKIDKKFYWCLPDYNNEIEKIPFNIKSKFIDNILVIFVTKISNSDNRFITCFCPKARIYLQKKSNRKINQVHCNNEKIKIEKSLIVSGNFIFVNSGFSPVIKINDYLKHMFKKHNLYIGNYYQLNNKVIKFINLLSSKLENDNDFNIQEKIQKVLPATIEKVNKAPNRNIEIENKRHVKCIKRDPQLSKFAIVRAKYLCQVNNSHKTFINQNGFSYMEGHHLIPCKINNANEIWNKFNKNVDCVENIVSICPNCHRCIHLGNWDTKNKKLKRLFNIQKNKLKNIGINISLNELLDFYK